MKTSQVARPRVVSPSQGEAPAEPPNAGPRSDRLPAFLRSSGDRCSARGRDAAQQELRPPGSAFCQKVKAVGRKSGGKVPVEPRTTAPQCRGSGPRITRIFTNSRSPGFAEIRFAKQRVLIRVNSGYSWTIAQRRGAGVQVHELLEFSRIVAARVLLKSDSRTSGF
jgi:hypothetical protein